MVSVGRHENITLLSYSEVEKVAGYVGNFSVTVRRKPRYVNEDLCTGCGTCAEKCPWKKIPSEFDLGLGKRSAIYFPFAQAVPRVPVVDVTNCAYFKTGKCRACEKFCPRGAIDFNQQEQHVEIEVGTIVLATGFQDFDPQRSNQYGYGVLDNVISGMEFERLINSGGPTTGKVLLKMVASPKELPFCTVSAAGEINTSTAHAFAACTRSSWRSWRAITWVQMWSSITVICVLLERIMKLSMSGSGGMGWISSVSTRTSTSNSTMAGWLCAPPIFTPVSPKKHWWTWWY